MTNDLTRRTLLKSALALAAGTALAPMSSYAATPPQRILRVTTRTIDVLGRAASVLGILDDQGAPGVYLSPGERFNVALTNELVESTMIHWHGQVPVPEQDGVADTGYVPVLDPGASLAFDFAARPGTHWMHAHHTLQEQLLLAAPLIVRTAEDEAADYEDVTVLLHDFTFRSPEEVFADLTGRTSMDHGSAGAMDHSQMNMSGGQDLNDVAYDAYLANDRTLADPLVVRTEKNARVRLRVINGASATAFWLDLGEVVGTVLAVDGNDVEPIAGSRFPLAPAQRIDLLLQVPSDKALPILAQREGDVARTGVILAGPGAPIEKVEVEAAAPAAAVDLSLEGQLKAKHGVQIKDAGTRHALMLTGSMSPYVWSIDERLWSNRKPLEVAAGQRVELQMMNHTMMAHPMHLHGHHFQVVAVNGNRFSGAMRDTVLVPPMSTVAVAFDTDNPGRWLLHCHNLYHMAAGMMTELVYTS